MNPVAERIFSALLRLYPTEFRRVYGEELELVFHDLLSAGEPADRAHAWRCLAREIATIPAGLIREYFSAFGGNLMKSSRHVLAVTVAGFFLLFLMLAFEFGYYRSQPGLGWLHSAAALWILLLIEGILFGLLGGGSLALALSVKRKVPMLILCGLGYVAATALTGPAYWIGTGIQFPWLTPDHETLLIYSYFPLLGLVLGVSAGLFWKGWKTAAILGLMGALIFAIGYWLNFISWWIIYGLGVDRLVRNGGVPLATWVILCWSIGYALVGIAVGILWGILIRRVQGRPASSPVAAP
jgi:hypothetical protein